MSLPVQPNPSPAGGDRDPAAPQTPIDLGFEENLRAFWAKYSGLILWACLTILLVIVGVHGWEWLQERRATARAQAYAAATTEAQLKSFAAEHSSTQLGGLAQLRLADQAYAAGRWSEAQAAYERALGPLSQTTFAGRARLGAAMSAVKAGQAGAGRTALQAILNDGNLPAALRSEAGYHLASLSAADRAMDEVAKAIEQITAIDPTSLWAQRAMMLRATLNLPAPAAPTDEASISFPLGTP